LREKPENQHRFVSTNIVPILNKCWPSTLGNVLFATKSLYKRGLMVLKYCLLDEPQVLDKPTKCQAKKFKTNNNQQEIDGSIADTLNPVSQRYLSMLDKLIYDRLKSDGRKRTYNAIVSKTTTKAQKIQHLEKMLNVSSGRLACNNIFCLDENVQDRMLIDENEKKQKQRELYIRKEQQQQKQQQTFRNAAITYFSGRTLVAMDIKSMLKHTAVPTGSPIKTKAQELRQQLHRC
jgi:capsule polysaccharide export protein KpsE/RkpR